MPLKNEGDSAEGGEVDEDDLQLINWLDFIAADAPKANGDVDEAEPSHGAMDRVLEWRAKVRPVSEIE